MNGCVYKRALSNVSERCDRHMLSATTFSLPGRKALSRPSDWLIRKLQKSLLRCFPVVEDVAIFLVQELAVVLSHFMSAFGCGGGSTSKRSRASRTALYESMMVACSMLLIEIS